MYYTDAEQVSKRENLFLSSITGSNLFLLRKPDKSQYKMTVMICKTLNIKSGIYYNSEAVSFSVNDPELVIRFTTNGKDPEKIDQVYKSYSTKPGYLPG